MMLGVEAFFSYITAPWRSSSIPSTSRTLIFPALHRPIKGPPKTNLEALNYLLVSSNSFAKTPIHLKALKSRFLTTPSRGLTLGQAKETPTLFPIIYLCCKNVLYWFQIPTKVLQISHRLRKKNFNYIFECRMGKVPQPKLDCAVATNFPGVSRILELNADFREIFLPKLLSSFWSSV